MYRLLTCLSLRNLVKDVNSSPTTRFTLILRIPEDKSFAISLNEPLLEPVFLFLQTSYIR